MRIVIDLQAAQSEGSRHRGIGRYSLALALAMARQAAAHEIIITLNTAFPDAIQAIRQSFNGVLPADNIRVWSGASPVAYADEKNDWLRQATELVREEFLESLKPDAVLVCSLFEGFSDDAVASIGGLQRSYVTAVTLYDLIPLIYENIYLENPRLRSWYFDKLEGLKRADLWLAISESSRQEGIKYLGFPAAHSVNVGTDADSTFRPIRIGRPEENVLREKYGLNRSFLMYTGGIDHRKNIEGLIRAYALLPQALRQSHQLVIVCSVQPETRTLLEKFAKKQGLKGGEVVFTGFVPEDDLLKLYNLCSLFVFPSWHEGFGLPALEAMRCGAPVIGANTSSLPEVIGFPMALFDPHSDEAMARLMVRALTDETFLADLIHQEQAQAKKFSWDESASRAIAAMEILVENKKIDKTSPAAALKPRPKLAYVSPLPPVRSGVADYSAELLPALSKYYEIDVIVAQDKVENFGTMAYAAVHSAEWFAAHANDYARVLYHFGNSEFHMHMFSLLRSHPGVVVLHDFYLSGVLHYMESVGYGQKCWEWALAEHGAEALSDKQKDAEAVLFKYPCSLDVIKSSLGVIAHSPNSLRLADYWYADKGTYWSVIPHMRDAELQISKTEARKKLRIHPDDFLVCSFGLLGPTKLNHRLLGAWLNSCLARDPRCRLVFVGANHGGFYGGDLLRTIQKSACSANIHITDWADRTVFHQYLAAADLGVQLRALSRGETSGTVLDCMNYSLATIVNANGSMADIDSDAVWMLPDEFSDDELVSALETLYQDAARRTAIGSAAREKILKEHSPERCAALYRGAIEDFYQIKRKHGLKHLLQAIAAIPAGIHGPSDEQLQQVSVMIDQSFPDSVVALD